MGVPDRGRWAVSSPDPILVGLLRWSGSAEVIFRQHQPVEGRCPLCRADGDSTGRVVAPCSLRRAAAAVLGMDPGA